MELVEEEVVVVVVVGGCGCRSVSGGCGGASDVVCGGGW